MTSARTERVPTTARRDGTSRRRATVGRGGACAGDGGRGRGPGGGAVRASGAGTTTRCCSALDAGLGVAGSGGSGGADGATTGGRRRSGGRARRPSGGAGTVIRRASRSVTTDGATASGRRGAAGSAPATVCQSPLPGPWQQGARPATQRVARPSRAGYDPMRAGQEDQDGFLPAAIHGAHRRRRSGRRPPGRRGDRTRAHLGAASGRPGRADLRALRHCRAHRRGRPGAAACPAHLPALWPELGDRS